MAGTRQYANLSDVPWEVTSDYPRGGGTSLQDLIDHNSARVTTYTTAAQAAALSHLTDLTGNHDSNAVERNASDHSYQNANRTLGTDPYDIRIFRNINFLVDGTADGGGIAWIRTGTSGDGFHAIFVNCNFEMRNPEGSPDSSGGDIYGLFNESTNADGFAGAFDFGESSLGRPEDCSSQTMAEARGIHLFGCTVSGFTSTNDIDVRFALGECHESIFLFSNTIDDDSNLFYPITKPGTLVQNCIFTSTNIIAVSAGPNFIFATGAAFANNDTRGFGFRVADNARPKLFGVDSTGGLILEFFEGADGSTTPVSNKNNEGEGWAKNINPASGGVAIADSSDQNDSAFLAGNTGSGNSSSADRQRLIDVLQYNPNMGAEGEGVVVKYTAGMTPGDSDPGSGGDWLGVTPLGNTDAAVGHAEQTIFLDGDGQINETSAYRPDSGDDGAISFGDTLGEGIQMPIRIWGPQAAITDGGGNNSGDFEVLLKADSNIDERHFFSELPDGSHRRNFDLNDTYLEDTYRTSARAGGPIDEALTIAANPQLKSTYADLTTRTPAGVKTQIDDDFDGSDAEVDADDFYAALLYTLYSDTWDNDINSNGAAIEIDFDLSIGETVSGSLSVAGNRLSLQCGNITKGTIATGITDVSTSGNIEIDLNGGTWEIDATGVDSTNQIEFEAPLNAADSSVAAAFSNCTLTDCTVELSPGSGNTAFIRFSNVDGDYTLNNAEGTVNVILADGSPGADFTSTGAGTTNLVTGLTIDWGVDLEEDDDGIVFVFDSEGSGTEAGSDFLNDNDPVESFTSGSSGTIASTNAAWVALQDENDLRIIFVKPGYQTGIFDFTVSTLSTSNISITPIQDQLYNVDAGGAVAGAEIALSLQDSNAGIDARTTSGGANGPTQVISVAQKFVTLQIMNADAAGNALVYAQSVGNNGADAAFTYLSESKIQFDTDYWDFAPASGDPRSPHYLSIYPIAGQVQSDLLSGTDNASDDGTLTFSAFITVTGDTVIDYERVESSVVAGTSGISDTIIRAVEDASQI